MAWTMCREMTKSNFTEHQCEREEHRSAVQASLDTLESKLQVEIKQLFAQQQAEHTSLSTLLDEMKLGAESQQFCIREGLWKERVDRQKDHVSLTDQLEARLREGLGQLTSEQQAFQSDVLGQLARTSVDMQSWNSCVQDAVAEQKTRLDACQSAFNGQLLEERATREQVRAALQTSLEALDAKVFDEIRRTSEEFQLSFQSMSGLISRHRSETDQCISDERAARWEDHSVLMGTVSACVDSSEASLQQFRATLDQHRAWTNDRFVEEQVLGEQRRVELQTSVEVLEGHLKSDTKRLFGELQAGQTTLHDLIALHGARTEAHEAAVSDLLSKESGLREEANRSLECMLDRKLDEEVVRMSKERTARESGHADLRDTLEALRGSLEDRIAQLVRDGDANVASLRSLGEAAQSTREEVLGQLREERTARDALCASLQDRVSESEQNAHVECREQRDALLALVEALDMKVQEDLGALVKDQRLKLLEVVAETKQGVDSQLRNHFLNEEAARERERASVGDRLETLERKISSSVAQESMDREAVQNKLQNLMQQQENATRAEARAETNRLWEAINSHTHDVSGQIKHTSHVKKHTVQGQSFHGSNSVRCASHSPTRASTASLEASSGALAIGSGLMSGGSSCSVPASLVSGSSTPRCGRVIETRAPTPMRPCGQVVGHARYPSTPVTRRHSASASALPVPTGSCTTIIPGMTPTSSVTIPRLSVGAQNMAGMMYSSEVIEREADEIKSLSCGPALYNGRGGCCGL